MNIDRRTLIQTLTSVGLIGISGCNSLECRLNGNYDRIRFKRIPRDRIQLESAIIINYSYLSPKLKKLVSDSINKGEIKQCHGFNENPSDIELFWKHISNRWDKIDKNTIQKSEQTYVRKNGNYYGVRITILDSVYVSSV